ncbi:MAG: NADH-quinone oxidoreductase subunit L [Planctomycetia bacterium]|nr:NADH-quinone oxidoreductase subunit L [Planctomycetia bacterium]
MSDPLANIRTLLVLVPALPLLAAVVTAVLGPRVLKSRAHWPVVLGLGLSAIVALMLLAEVNRHSRNMAHDSKLAATGHVTLWRWTGIPDVLATPPAAAAAMEKAHTTPPRMLPFDVDVTLRVDPLTALMLSMVTFVSFLVAIYAVGYMHGDRSYWRFFAYVGLFVFSMTMLVLVSNFLLLYVFWEAVGMCSYLLIGFWYQKPEAAAAGKKAFLVNRVGDFGFALGIFLIWITYGTLNFHDTTLSSGGVLPGVLGQIRLGDASLYVPGGLATAICLLLLVGACGKSAQFPLHVWLPDAMEGPTPVSALIHAATMVTAGVYMIVRCTPLFGASPQAQQVVAIIGGLTALLAAIIAVTQTDLKRILAYSTISQLGYMFLGLGTGSMLGISAGMFHLLTHAFFKALLFLGAGSVMHALGGVIDLRQFSGLRRKMPVTCWTFLIGCLALAGVLPFAGFWSKDRILAAVHERAHAVVAGYHSSFPVYEWLYWVAIGTAFLTAFYTFRAFFLAFCGPERVPAAAHPHESPNTMTLPLAILAAFAAGIGLTLEAGSWFDSFLAESPSLAALAAHETGPAGSHLHVAVLSTVVVLIGIGLAAFFYLGERTQIDRLAMWLRPVYEASHRKLWFDEVYDLLIVGPLRILAYLLSLVDRFLIDGLVNLIGRLPVWLGAVLRPTQNGLLQSYALAMAIGVLVLLGTLVLF